MHVVPRGNAQAAAKSSKSFLVLFFKKEQKICPWASVYRLIDSSVPGVALDRYGRGDLFPAVVTS
jgi:hypothetical protein